MSDTKEKRGETGNLDKPLPRPLHPLESSVGIFQGIQFPTYGGESVEDRVTGVDKFTLKEDDVLVCAYPRSGTHWMLRIVQMVINGTVEYRAGHSYDQVFLDMQPLHLLDNLDPPRVLTTHYPFNFLPAQVKDGGNKVVHLYRNPKAAMVSMHFMLHSTAVWAEGTLASMFDSFFQEKGRLSLRTNEEPYGNWFYHTDTVLDFASKYPHVPIFHVSFEDLKENTMEGVKQIARFLEKDISEELCSEIASAVSFSSQKQKEEAECDDRSFTAAVGIFRKGEIDDWKNHLSVAQSEKFDEHLSQRAAVSSIFARYLCH